MLASELDADIINILNELCGSLSGDLERALQRILGRAATPEAERMPTGVEEGVTGREPAANPLGWVPELMRVCCEAYGAPPIVSAPVAACLVLLGISSSIFDAAQDEHEDLLRLLGVGGVNPELASISADNRARNEHDRDESAITMSRLCALASNAGLALTALAWQALYAYGPRYGIEPAVLMSLGDLLSRSMLQACEAQHLDLSIVLHPPQELQRPYQASNAESGWTTMLPGALGIDAYQRLIEGKSGLISAAACEAAAILALGASRSQEACGPEYALRTRAHWRDMGMAREVGKQICDDYVDFDEDVAAGRQPGAQLLYALSVASSIEVPRILVLLAAGRGSTDEAKAARLELRALVRDLGADYYVLALLALQRDQALAVLHDLGLGEEAQGWLRGWITRVAPS